VGTPGTKQANVSCDVIASGNQKQKAFSLGENAKQPSPAKKTKVTNVDHSIYHGGSCNTYSAQHPSAAAYYSFYTVYSKYGKPRAIPHTKCLSTKSP